MLPEEIFTDAARSGARIFRNAREVIRTGRDRSTPRDVNTTVATAMLTPQGPILNSTSNSPTRNGNQDIVIPKRSIIATEARKAEPLDAPINRILAVHGHPTSIFSKVIGPKTVSGESANVYARKRMDFASNSVVAESPNFMDLGLSPAHTTGDLKSVISRATRIEGLKYSSDSLASKKGIEEVTFERVSEVQAYINYIKNLEFETMNVFERENISVT